jgi:hypothetical protein
MVTYEVTTIVEPHLVEVYERYTRQGGRPQRAGGGGEQPMAGAGDVSR